MCQYVVHVCGAYAGIDVVSGDEDKRRLPEGRDESRHRGHQMASHTELDQAQMLLDQSKSNQDEACLPMVDVGEGSCAVSSTG